MSNDTLALGFRAVLACLFAMGWPSFFVGLPTSRAGFRRRGVACFDVVGLLYLGVRLPSSPWGCVLRRWVSLLRRSPLIIVVWLELWRWAFPVVVGCPATVFSPPRRCVVWDLS